MDKVNYAKTESGETREHQRLVGFIFFGLEPKAYLPFLLFLRIFRCFLL